MIEESPEGAGKDGSGVGVVDMESVELTVMDDIHSSDSPQVVRRAAEENANNSNSSDEDDSSGSEEDRYCIYKFLGVTLGVQYGGWVGEL